jgi:uncharacterized protein with GYD domain
MDLVPAEPLQLVRVERLAERLLADQRSLGNVRTRTVRAWPEAEMTKLISELP